MPVVFSVGARLAEVNIGVDDAWHHEPADALDLFAGSASGVSPHIGDLAVFHGDVGNQPTAAVDDGRVADDQVVHELSTSGDLALPGRPAPASPIPGGFVCRYLGRVAPSGYAEGPGVDRPDP